MVGCLSFRQVPDRVEDHPRGRKLRPAPEAPPRTRALHLGRCHVERRALRSVRVVGQDSALVGLDYRQDRSSFRVSHEGKIPTLLSLPCPSLNVL
jgi:hypothetical protein